MEGGGQLDAAARREQRETLVARLVELRQLGRLTTADVRQAARAVGAGERTVWGWVRAGAYVPRRRTGWMPSLRARELFYASAGNVEAVHRALLAEGEPVPSASTLRRAFGRVFSPAERAYATGGAEGARARSVYLRWEPDARGEIYEADHKQLSIEVLARRAQHPARPWATLFLDGFSRLIVGWALSLRPTQAEVLAALRMAIVVDPDRGAFGGVPLALRFDNGLEFAANAVEDACAALGCLAQRATPYAPWQKGKIERLNRTLETDLLAGLPRWTAGPRRPDGRLYDARQPLTLERFVGLFAAWVAHYNTERPHRALDGRTPLERWQEDARPVPSVAPERARWLLMPEVTRRVHKDGVHFAALIYVAPELNGLVGETIGVRFMPHDRRQVELYRNGGWLATAKPQGTLNADERARVLERRRSDAEAMGREARRARRRARVRLAPLTRPGTSEEITVVTHGEPDGRVRPFDAEQSGPPSLRLLGLRPGVDEADAVTEENVEG